MTDPASGVDAGPSLSTATPNASGAKLRRSGTARRNGSRPLGTAMAAQVDIRDVAPPLAELLERVRRGEEILIADAGRAIARIIPADPPARVFGAYKGRVTIADDFDDALPPEIQAGFER